MEQAKLITSTAIYAPYWKSEDVECEYTAVLASNVGFFTTSKDLGNLKDREG